MQAETMPCEKCAQLEEALESRTTIGTAIGLLMERERIDQDEAFGMLRTASQHTNRKLRDIAADLVSSAGAVAKAHQEMSSPLETARPHLKSVPSGSNGASA